MQTIKDHIIEAIRFVRKDLQGQPLIIDKLYKDFITAKKIPARKMTKYVETPPKTRATRLKIEAIVYTWSEQELSILQMICDIHRVELNHVLSLSRKREVIDCRKQAMVFFYAYFDYTTVTAGLMFKRDHSTIIHALETHNNLLQTHPKYYRLFKACMEVLEKNYGHLFVQLKPKESSRDGTKFLERTRWSAILKAEINE